MSTEPQRTDYAPPEVFKERAGGGRNMKRSPNERFFAEPQWIDIAFDTSFDSFAANAAHALRHRLFYRTDGGRFARGLVRESGDLQRIHQHYKDSAKLPSSTKVRLLANIVRRKDRIPTEQWELTVRFFVPVEKVDVDEPHITKESRYGPGADVVAEERKMTEMVLGIASIVARDINKINRNRGERIIKIAAIADKLGYPSCLYQWYYNPELVRQYLNLHTTNARRRDMTAANGSKLPFEGHGASQAGDWRRYPFREMIRECFGKPSDICRAIVHNRLLLADDHIFAITERVREADGKPAIGGGSTWGPLVDKFMRHLKELQDSPTNFLSAYKQK